MGKRSMCNVITNSSLSLDHNDNNDNNIFIHFGIQTLYYRRDLYIVDHVCIRGDSEMFMLIG